MPRPAEVPPYGRLELMKEVRAGLKTGTYSMQVANALYIPTNPTKISKSGSQ